MSIETRYRYVADQVREACGACGRDPESVRLIAVSKTVDAGGVAEAIAAGACDFGENRIESLAPKYAAHPEARWHFIGNIQSRKIREIARVATTVHSLYQLSHVAKFESACAELGKTLDVLVEVNVSGEESKSGCSPREAQDIVEAICACPHLRARGLMTMAPRHDQEADSACFTELSRLKDEIAKRIPPDDAEMFDELSMGMSEDWRLAIPAGATMVRIGRAVFDDAFEPPTQR